MRNSRPFISTRPLEKAQELLNAFSEEAYSIINCPMIEVYRKEISEEEKVILSNLSQCKWVVFTSPNGVRYFFEHVRIAGINIDNTLKFAVIGKATEKELNSININADFVSPIGNGKAFAEALEAEIGLNEPMIWATGSIAPVNFEHHFNRCKRIEVYSTRKVNNLNDKIKARISSGDYEMILAFSPSAVESLVDAFSTPDEKLKFACIGETTKSKCLELGYTPLATAETPSVEGILNAVTKYLNL